MDQVEELAAAWGMDPREVFVIPWKKFRLLWDSYQRRVRRNMRLEASLRGIDLTRQMFGGAAASGGVGGGGASADTHSNPYSSGDVWNQVVNDRVMPPLSRRLHTETGALREHEVNRLAMVGMPVVIVNKSQQADS